MQHRRLTTTATATAAARQRNEFGHNPYIEVLRNIDRRLQRLDPVDQVVVVSCLHKKLLALGLDAYNMLSLGIIGGKTTLCTLHRILAYQMRLDGRGEPLNRVLDLGVPMQVKAMVRPWPVVVFRQ